MVKICSDCKKEKCLSEFYKKGPGTMSYCKSCSGERYRAWVKTDLFTEWKKKTAKRRNAWSVEYSKRPIEKEKKRARWLVYSRIRSGEIKKYDCFCGDTAQAHHADYSKPYEINWLCKQHHEEIHHQKK